MILVGRRTCYNLRVFTCILLLRKYSTWPDGHAYKLFFLNFYMWHPIVMKICRYVLPSDIKTEFNNPKKFKVVLQKFLCEKSFYSLDEYFDLQKREIYFWMHIYQSVL